MLPKFRETSLSAGMNLFVAFSTAMFQFFYVYSHAILLRTSFVAWRDELKMLVERSSNLVLSTYFVTAVDPQREVVQ